MQQRTLDDVVDALRHTRDVRKRGCSLLIGAGCSATAGVETAAGFVKLIEQRFKGADERASEKTYPKCMAKLARGQQRDLIIEQVSKARINWAHMAVAQLIRNGFVDRVLTTNFDPLVLRACAMLGQFPAVYDVAISQLFRPGELPEKAIFHLHGQSTGFVLMNTDKEVEDHSQRLGPLFQDAGQARPWIVVGYSGDNDPSSTTSPPSSASTIASTGSERLARTFAGQKDECREWLAIAEKENTLEDRAHMETDSDLVY